MKEDWKECKLGEVCESISETYSRKDDFVVLINTSDVLEGKILTHQMIKNENLKGQFKKTFQKNDILYSEIRPANKRYAFVDFENTEHYIASTKLMVIRPNLDIISPKFLFLLLTSKKLIEEMQHLAETRSGTFPQITFSGELATFSITLPPLATQQKIAAILSSLDDKIELNNKINDNLEQQAQAIFKSWFVDFEPFGGKMPEEWRVGKLSEIIRIKYGKDHKKLKDGNYPVYGSGGIMRKVDKYLYDKESVLIPRKGTLNNVFYINEPFWSVDTMFYTEMKKENIAKYVYFFVKGKDLNAMNAGSAVPSMTTEILNAMEVMIPDDKQLEKFDALVLPMFKQMKQNIIENEKLVSLRDTLLPKLMNGEIEV